MATPANVISDVTINQFRRAAWKNAEEKRVSIGYLAEKGKINEDSKGGDLIYWPVEAGLYDAYTVGDYEDNLDKFVPNKRHTKATLDWGLKRVFDAISKFSLQKNRGEEALVNIARERLPAMMMSLVSQGNGTSAGKGSLNYEFLRRDGGSYTGDGLPFFGLPSVFKFDTGLATSAKDAVVTSGSTYAGLSLENGGLSGTVDVDRADAWEPKSANIAFDWDGTGGSSTSLTVEHFPRIMNYLQTRVTYASADETQRPDCVIHDRTNFNVGRDYIGDKQSIYINREDSGNRKWGLGNSAEGFNHNGLMHYWDDQMPSEESYMLNFDQIELAYLSALGMVSGDNDPGGKNKGDLKGLPASMIDVECQYSAGRNGITLDAQVAAQFLINPRYQGLIKDFS